MKQLIHDESLRHSKRNNVSVNQIEPKKGVSMKKVLVIVLAAVSFQAPVAFGSTGKADCRAMSDLKKGIFGSTNPITVAKAAQNPPTKTANANTAKGRF
jgi:hypothetical protein